MKMKNKLVSTALISLVFIGCTKTISITEPGTYYQETPVTQSRPTYETVNSPISTTPTEAPYVEETNVPRQLSPFNIKPLDAFDILQENQDVFLLDVRMVNEIPKDGKIANSVMIPLQVLAQNLNRLDKSKTIIVYCHTGNRSVEATKLLRKNGFNAINMVGGIEAWKQQHLSVRWK